MATVFVTGANGKLGRATCRALLAAGHQVRALSRSEPTESLGVSWTHGDILDPSTYTETLRGCDAVIHYAAELREPAKMDNTNVAATMPLLEASSALGVRYFCFTSSVSVYGSPQQRLVTEDSPPVDPTRSMNDQYFNRAYIVEYARTKATAERAIQRGQLNLVIDIIRPSVVRDRDELLEIGDMSKVVRMLMAPHHSQYVLTEDLAHAVCHLMTQGLSQLPRVEVFNLADDTNPTYREIMEVGYALTRQAKFQVPVPLPALADMIKYRLTYRRFNVGVPLGYQKISNKKLLATGFVFPIGVENALNKITETN